MDIQNKQNLKRKSHEESFDGITLPTVCCRLSNIYGTVLKKEEAPSCLVPIWEEAKLNEKLQLPYLTGKLLEDLRIISFLESEKKKLKERVFKDPHHISFVKTTIANIEILLREISKESPLYQPPNAKEQDSLKLEIIKIVENKLNREGVKCTEQDILSIVNEVRDILSEGIMEMSDYYTCLPSLLRNYINLTNEQQNGVTRCMAELMKLYPQQLEHFLKLVDAGTEEVSDEPNDFSRYFRQDIGRLHLKECSYRDESNEPKIDPTETSQRGWDNTTAEFYGVKHEHTARKSKKARVGFDTRKTQWLDNDDNVVINTMKLHSKQQHDKEVIKNPKFNNYTIIYTDGSVLSENNAGASFFSSISDYFVRFNTRKSSTTEAIALLITLIYFTNHNYKNIAIFSDCLTVVEAIEGKKRTDPIINAIRQNINFRSLRGMKTEVQWIKAHIGIFGNEEADRLARTGALSENYLKRMHCNLSHYTHEYFCQLSCINWKKRPVS